MSRHGKIRLLLVDDHECVRAGLRTLLSKDPLLQIVGEAGKAPQAIKEAARLTPDVVLMDVRLGDSSGIEACRQIRSQRPSTRVLFLTSYPDDEAILATLTAGAEGFLLKEIDVDALIHAIKSVMAGQSILDPVATRRVHANLLGRAQADKLAELSHQEQRVLALIADGRTNKEIAQALALSPKTIKNYISHMFEKLQVTRRSQATALFVRHANPHPEAARAMGP